MDLQRILWPNTNTASWKSVHMNGLYNNPSRMIPILTTYPSNLHHNLWLYIKIFAYQKLVTSKKNYSWTPLQTPKTYTPKKYLYMLLPWYHHYNYTQLSHISNHNCPRQAVWQMVQVDNIPQCIHNQNHIHGPVIIIITKQSHYILNIISLVKLVWPQNKIPTFTWNGQTSISYV